MLARSREDGSLEAPSFSVQTRPSRQGDGKAGGPNCFGSQAFVVHAAG